LWLKVELACHVKGKETYTTELRRAKAVKPAAGLLTKRLRSDSVAEMAME
jgi:hypothetical protein